MNYNILILGILIFAFITPIVTANYTPVMNTSTNDIAYNKSYSYSTGGLTPFPIWLLLVLAGFYLLVFSCIATPEQSNDIFAALAIIPLGLSTWMSLSIDMLSGFGVTSQTNAYVMLEQHTIYSNTGITIILLIFFIISLLNAYRIIFMMNDNEDEEY